MTADVVLTIDLGTSGPKVGLVDRHCQLLAQAFEPVGTRFLPSAGAEQDPDRWWQSLCLATRRLLDGSGLRARINAICVTGQWSGTVAVDERGRALTPALIWLDGRGAPHVKRLTRGWVRVGGYGAHRLARWVRLTGGAPGLTGRDPVGHIAFLRHEQPDLMARASLFLEPISYLNLQLTGVARASYDSMALHWVTDNRDPFRIRYDQRLLDWAELDRDWLPELCSATDIIGTLLPRPAGDLGLEPGIPVVAGTADVHSAALGSGALGLGQPHLYVGTSSWLSAHVATKQTNVSSNMASLPAALPGKYLLMNEQQTAGACLSYLKDQLFEGCTLGAGAQSSWFAALDQAVATTNPGAGGLLFFPWLNGERSPVEDGDLRGGFFNLSLRTTQAQLFRAVLEGVALNARWLKTHVERFIRRPIDSLRLVGGGARSDVWCQIYADVLACPVERISDPVAVGLKGAAVLAWSAVEKQAPERIAEQITLDRTFLPNPAYQALYRDHFEHFLEFHRHNVDQLRRLNRSGSSSS